MTFSLAKGPAKPRHIRKSKLTESHDQNWSWSVSYREKQGFRIKLQPSQDVLKEYDKHKAHVMNRNQLYPQNIESLTSTAFYFGYMCFFNLHQMTLSFLKVSRCQVQDHWDNQREVLCASGRIVHLVTSIISMSSFSACTGDNDWTAGHWAVSSRVPLASAPILSYLQSVLCSVEVKSVLIC